MSDLPSKPRRKRRWKILAGIGLAFVILTIAAGFYLNSDRFRERMRQKIVEEVQKASGGRAELRALRWNLSKLEFELTDLTLHGTEPEGQAPFVHIDRLYLRARIISLFSRKLGVNYLLIERPAIHIIVNPDGATNMPTPEIPSGKRQQSDPIQSLFDLQADKVELRDGVLFYNGRKIPLEFNGQDLSAHMEFDAGAQRYAGTVNLGKLDAKFHDMRPVSANFELQFGLRPDSVELKSLRLSTPRSRLEASGQLKDFKRPNIELTYNASLDAAELGGILRMSELSGGTVELKGSGNYGVTAFASTGKLLIRNLLYAAPGINVPGAQLSSDFSLDQEHISLSNIQGAVYGGRLNGDAEIHDWVPAPGRLQRGAANIRLADIDLAAIAAAFSTRTLPLDRINPAGRASGVVQAKWTGSPTDTDAAIQLDVHPPAAPARNQLPVDATLRAAYNGRAQTIRIDRLTAATRAARMTAAGTVGSTTAELKVNVIAADLGEMQPILAAFGRPGQMPVEIDGRLSFNGSVSGRLTAPTVAGHLEVSDFTTILAARQPTNPAPAVAATTAPPQSQQTTRRLHWDQFIADLRYTSREIAVNNGLLRSGSARIGFAGSLGLRQGRFTETSPFAIRMRVTDAQIRDLQAIAGFNYPVSGLVNLSLDVHGTARQPLGSGQLRLTNVTAYGEAIPLLTSDLGFSGHEARLGNIVIQHEAARILGSAAYDLTTRQYLFEFKGQNINLSRVRYLSSQKLRVTGMGMFTARGSGDLDHPVLNASVRLTDLVINEERVGGIALDAVTEGEMMRLTARSDFRDSDLRLDASIRLRGDFPATLKGTFSRFDIDPYLQAFMPGKPTGHTVTGGTIEASGPLRRPTEMAANVYLDTLQANLQNVDIRNQGPIRFSMRNQVVRVEEFHLVGDGTDLQANGTVQLALPRSMDLAANGKFNLRLLQTFNDQLIASGFTTLDVRARGDLRHPDITGRMDIANASIALIDLPNALSNVNGTLVFNENRLQVQSLTARTGGGDLQLGGFINYAQGVNFNLTATGADIRVRYPEGVSALADLDLRLSGSLKGSTLGGDVSIKRFALNQQFDLALYLARSKQPPRPPDPNSPLTVMRLDIHVTSAPELQVQTTFAKIAGNIDIRVRGTALQPTVLGRTNITEGEVSFNNQTYELDRGDVVFTNPMRIEPVLNITASTRIRDYEITIELHGSIDHLKPNYRSDPPLPTGDIIALLALGRTQEEVVLNPTPEGSFTESASNAILGQALNMAVSNRVQKLFGVSRIKIDPDVGGPSGNPSARLTIEQQVNKNFNLTYITDLTRTAQPIIQVEYTFNKDVSLLAGRDQNGIVSFDVRVRQRKK